MKEEQFRQNIKKYENNFPVIIACQGHVSDFGNVFYLGMLVLFNFVVLNMEYILIPCLIQ